jgi:hypothetical protein
MKRTVARISFAVLAALLLPFAPAHAQDDPSRAVADGGIFVEGWTGRVDAREAQAGLTLRDARFEQRGDALHARTGPAITYWNPANVASGDYTVSARFHEPAYMSHNNHPHPYGIVIAGSNLGTDDQRYLYCAAYGNGNFIVRGFGPEPFQLNGRRGEEHEAVNRAAGPGEPVEQEIAMTVRGGSVECAINGTVVARYDRSEVVQDGRLPTTDGVYGVRFGHNTEATVSGLSITRH